MGRREAILAGIFRFLQLGYAVGYAFGYANLSRKKRNALIGYAFGYVLFKGEKYHIKNNANQHV